MVTFSKIENMSKLLLVFFSFFFFLFFFFFFEDMETKAQAWLKSNQIKNEDRKTPSPLKIEVVKSDIQTGGQHEVVLSKGR